MNAVDYGYEHLLDRVVLTMTSASAGKLREFLINNADNAPTVVWQTCDALGDALEDAEAWT